MRGRGEARELFDAERFAAAIEVDARRARRALSRRAGRSLLPRIAERLSPLGKRGANRRAKCIGLDSARRVARCHHHDRRVDPGAGKKAPWLTFISARRRETPRSTKTVSAP